MTVDITLFLPELFQIAVILALFVQSVWTSDAEKEDQNRLTNPAGWLSLAALINLVIAGFCLESRGILLWEAYLVDGLSQFFKFAVALGFAVVVWNASHQPTLPREKQTDYFLLLSLSTLGLMGLASAVEMITIFLALELSSYSLYALIPLRGDDPRASEAGIKYILFGAAATALSLFGLSYVLMEKHSGYLAVLGATSWEVSTSPLAAIGLTLFMAGFFYKLALFPFHFWAPDVYDGTSNETAAYVATLPKLGAVVVLIRLAAVWKPDIQIATVLAVLGALSMTFGNLAALTQQDVKRMLGYSSVAHAGTVMVGLVAGTAAGLAAAGFYSLIYVLMNLTCFWVVCRVSTDGRNLKLADLNGLYSREPILAFVLAVAALSLVGLPPTAGFMGKLFLFSAAWGHGFNWLVVTAVLNTAVSIYYYLNFIRHAYTREAEDAAPAVPRTADGIVWGGVLSCLLLLLGMIPSPVYHWAEVAGRMLLP